MARLRLSIGLQTQSVGQDKMSAKVENTVKITLANNNILTFANAMVLTVLIVSNFRLNGFTLA